MALGLKGLDYEQSTYDLRRGDQRQPRYGALAPHKLVPALEVDGTVLTQSPAILEWLEERYPMPPLLPSDPDDRAIVRAMAATIACDVHPLNNLRVLDTLRSDFDAAPEGVSGWIARWINDGFTVLETMVAQHGHGFAFGDAPTLADCHIVPQIYSAERFGVDLSPYPALVAACAAARALRPVEAAHPDRQPDADAA